MGHVVVNTGPVMGKEVQVSTSAMELVRLSFNPAGLESVARIKSLAAALISECEAIRDACHSVENYAGAREASIAITHIQTASMFAVAADTSGR